MEMRGLRPAQKEQGEARLRPAQNEHGDARAPSRAKIMPDLPLSQLLSPDILSRLKDYPLLARTAVEGFLTGTHRSVCRGAGCEFVQYRPYISGDDLRFLDWRLLARQNRSQVKVFQEETQMRCAILVDASASMAYRGHRAPCTKFRYAAMVAACFAYLAQRQGDKVGLFTYADSLMTGARSTSSLGTLDRLLAILDNVTPQGHADHFLAASKASEFLRQRGLLVLISDFYDLEPQLERLLRLFQHSHHDCLLCQVLDDDELSLPMTDTTVFTDSESGNHITASPQLVREPYQRRMNDFLAAIRQTCLDCQTDYQLATTSQNLGPLLSAWLDRRRASAS